MYFRFIFLEELKNDYEETRITSVLAECIILQ
jgi:hypothetical protein